MMRYDHLKHAFVEHIPDTVEAGVLYISMEYGTAAHSCCCGCGQEVVTPFTPTDWKMIFDGETVSLNPSIGNWTLDCRSHYVIKRGRVIEAGPWSDKQVADERLRDKKAKAKQFGAAMAETPNVTVGEKPVLMPASPGLIQRFWKRVLRILGN